ALARALVCGTELLLLDEPFEGLGPALARRLAGVIHDLPGRGAAVLVTDSDPRRVANLADVVYTIERGEIVAANRRAE
ncbi:MAG: ABC transporter ATP-binding protein, partial [Anaerolineae bacterium]|nr:ABC transporter ATP-binding protein [Anaerolineae bacterium]